LEEKKGATRGVSIYNNLSKSLIKEINKESYLSYLKNILFFKQNFSDNFLIELCQKIKEISLAP